MVAVDANARVLQSQLPRHDNRSQLDGHFCDCHIIICQWKMEIAGKAKAPSLQAEVMRAGWHHTNGPPAKVSKHKLMSHLENTSNNFEKWVQTGYFYSCIQMASYINYSLGQTKHSHSSVSQDQPRKDPRRWS